MSTFRGVVAEFPDIRVDYFRTIAGRVPPLACFLSHVHSDHLQGLESLKAPFVYCSSSTRELLLRIERYPHRMNFAKGILEAKRQHYRHLKMLLKPIPLNTPTEIELKPSYSIRVTLFDVSLLCPGNMNRSDRIRRIIVLVRSCFLSKATIRPLSTPGISELNRGG